MCVYHCTPPNHACAEGLLTSEVYKHATNQIDGHGEVHVSIKVLSYIICVREIYCMHVHVLIIKCKLHLQVNSSRPPHPPFPQK